ncbi:uncharacterized protein E0L32_009697 [Thyridium curvatum]|uniref:Septation initiation network scaffold protein cdc11 n=1 Tax=Thyridium curvatum TaxID=1093900 RepID=A0A507AVA8_9PEZI|nr:uncharacterized protein E0L32_009697 [Thyridium curvatum]TPX08879.1 hypothetical protein E0L32_009697 [Thyridium curvatum]
MEHAWLDSLSEDWVSQLGSDPSHPAHSLSLPRSTKRHGSRHRSKSGQIKLARPEFGTVQSHSTRSDSSNILSERSANDINIPLSHHGPSKLSQEFKASSSRTRVPDRSVSVSTTDSVIHNTVDRKTSGASPLKDKGDTPEWKRRLIYGDLSYGEQRDLFTSAATGLENIFKPPVMEGNDLEDLDEEEEDDAAEYRAQHNATMPSSPPIPSGEDSSIIHADDPVAQHAQDQNSRPKTRMMNYRPNDESSIWSANTGMSGTAEEVNSPSEPSLPSVPSLPATLVDGAESRKVSGQSVLRHEDFSPIVLTHRTPGPGGARPGLVSLDVQPHDLRQRLEKLRRNQMRLASEIDSVTNTSLPSAAFAPSNIDNTREYEKMGGFINFRRGGRSAEGSFQHRPLSPPLPTDTSEMLPEESLQASTPKQFPTVRIDQAQAAQTRFSAGSPPLPRAPNPSPEKRDISGQTTGGSPLKLFGPYDTFTNQTLMRRISQFEDQISNGSQTSIKRHAPAHEAPETSHTELNKAFVASPQKVAPEEGSRRPSARFGAGELDGYEFHEEMSLNSQSGLDVAAETEGYDDMFPPGHQEPHHVLSETSLVDDATPDESSDLVITRRRQRSSTTSTMHSAKHQGTFDKGDVSEMSLPTHGNVTMSTPQRRDATSESKRPRTSPSKDPTPKRRRTLHKSDIAYAAGQSKFVIDPVQSSHQQMQSVIGRKRRDARDGDLQQLANPSVLAARQILRPRTPTPSQRSSVQREAHPFDADGDEPLSAKQPAHPLRPNGPHPVDDVEGTDRKPSIRTEDFINEANKIMAIIRNRAGVQSGLASVEESDLEHGNAPPEDVDDSVQESTKEPLSRPPSREGRPIPRIAPRQEDPELIARLKKYEERSDMGDVINSSVRSMSLAQDAIRAAKQVEEGIQHTIRHSTARATVDLYEEVISDPPNIRISMNPVKMGSQPGQNGEAGDSLRDGLNSRGSSSGNSTGRSIPTTSSRGSESKRRIAPETVSHLIPDQVGNMFLDRQHNIWIKKKNREPSRGMHSILPSENSEDDPFADIPDLSVDMTMELRNLARKAAAEKTAELAGNANLAHSSPQAQPRHNANFSEYSRVSSVERPPSQRDTSILSPSWLMSQFAETSDDEVEHEIGIYEDRKQYDTPRRKNLTISFSSPIASIIQDVVADNLNESGSEDGGEISFVQAVESGRGPSLKTKNPARVVPLKSRSASLGSGKPMSLRGETFIPRPVSRIDERDEDSSHVADASLRNQELSVVGDEHMSNSILHEQRQTSVSFVVATPARPKARVQSDTEEVLAEYVGMLSLTPLSEFTIHDQSMGLEASYILGNRHLVTGEGKKRIMSQTLRDLVDRLTEVEPFLPQWEEMEELKIQDKQLTSLHMLDEFCGRLVTIDASENAIRNASGIPNSVRNLRIVHNQLSELTAWGHLSNLQYLDISGNDIKTLSGLKNLVHLRSVRADNCNLRDINALKGHDALQSLRARNNQITSVDFHGTRLQRLTELDLEGNQLTEVLNLDQLPCLSSLNLQNNKLESLFTELNQHLNSLRVLKVSDNHLRSLDVSGMPLLHVLYADRNRLVTMEGFPGTPRLDSLSLREQLGSTSLDVSSVYYACEVRKLYLSGNLLKKFEPPTEFLNLQLLELANCGLESLPEDFGQLMPNLRKLNLNFNAMADLKCLRNIPRLKRLFAAGNRLGSALSTVEVLAEFPFLAEADFRDNPITQGFYSPLQVVASVDRQCAVDPFLLPDADVERDQAYCSRLDLGTGMRRRIYEQVYGESCLRLKKLDGLPARKDIAQVRDSVWMALVMRGVVPGEDGTLLEAVESEKQLEESRWAAEDSFA